MSLAPAARLLLAAILLATAPGAKPPADDPIRLNNLGIAYLAQFKPAEAEKQFRLAVAADPGYVAGHVNIGIAALAQVHYEDAMTAFGKALALDPNNIYAHFNVSLIHKLQGKAQEALDAGLKALQLDPRDPDIHYHVGSLYMTLRDYDKGIREMETVLKLDPNFLSAYYSLGRAWMARGDTEKGRKYIEKHQELQAGAAARAAVGLRYGEQGRYSFAMEDTGSGMEAGPLAAGDVTFEDVSAGSGITWSPVGGGSIAGLRRAPVPSPGPWAETLRRTVGPLFGSGVAVADVDGDGKDDLFLPGAGGSRPESALYLNRGGLRFERLEGAGAPALADGAMAAVFGDLDRDGDADLVVALIDRVQIFANDGKGRFKDITTPAGVTNPPRRGLLGGISLADVDHDGDLDLFAAGFLGDGPAPKTPFPSGWAGDASLLFINATPPPAAGETAAAPPAPPAPRFVESASRAKVAHAGRRSTGAVFSDFDNDRDIDFAIAAPGDASKLYANRRDGTFDESVAIPAMPGAVTIVGLTAADYDKDGWMDLAATAWEGGLPRLFRNVMGDPSRVTGTGGAFALDIGALADVARQIATPQFGIVFLDFDNDGFLDLITANGGDVGPALFVFRGLGGGRFAEAGDLTGAEKIRAMNGRGLAASDLDQDGDLDLIISNSGGRPTLVRNNGGNRNHWVRIAPGGLHSNKGGVGTKVEVKAGRLWQKVEVTAGSGYLSQSAATPHFGLGPLARVDTVRLLWPGGVLQDEIQVAHDAVVAVEELDRKGSSCPILYAWNGTGVAFVSDFLGGSAIGYRTGPTTWNYPDTEEYVRVTADQLQPKDGRLLLRFVNQLEETIYFDRARLIAVDHPRGSEIFPDERLMPGPPYPPFRLHVVTASRPLVAARDDQGRDRLADLARIDRVYVEPPAALPYKGYTTEHRLTLDLGDLEPDAPVVLLLHGWIDYADSTSNLAAAQAGASLVPPWLEAWDGAEGRWDRILPQMGFPAGLPKTMTVDLTGRLPRGARTIRIGTSMRIFWDEARVATGFGSSTAVTAVEAGTAQLRFRGFPALVSPDGRGPEVYDYARDQQSVHWKSHTGAYTRYGEVRELLAAVDDRYVITRPGDEIALEFPVAGLPPLPADHVRDYLVHTDGFGKDMDLNSARPDSVGPLPWHGMPSYPYPAKSAHPFTKRELMEYHETYNTRRVGASITPLRAP